LVNAIEQELRAARGVRGPALSELESNLSDFCGRQYAVRYGQ
jgi:hypothetical protein